MESTPASKLLAVGVMPRNSTPLNVFQSQCLAVHAVVFPIVKGIGQADVEAIQPCPKVVGNRNRNENIVGCAVPGGLRGGNAPDPYIRLRAIHDQLDDSAGCREPFDFCFSRSDVHDRPPRRTCRRAALRTADRGGA